MKLENKVRLHLILGFMLLAHITCWARPGKKQGIRVPFCTLVSNPIDFDQKKAVTSAIISAGYHSVIAYDLKCMPTEMNNVSTEVEISDSVVPGNLLKKLQRYLKHHKNATVVFEGVFKARGGPYGSDAARFRFTVTELISVRESRVPRGQLSPT
jgi:hypothetical protein